MIVDLKNYIVTFKIPLHDFQNNDVFGTHFSLDK